MDEKIGTGDHVRFVKGGTVTWEVVSVNFERETATLRRRSRWVYSIPFERLKKVA